MDEPTLGRSDAAPAVCPATGAQSLYDQMFDQAVDALTRVARITWHSGGPDSAAAAGRFDWARFVTEVVAAAAANVGSTDAALTGAEPDSVATAALRDLLAATVGVHDEQLLAHRTSPVVVDVPVEDLLDRAGVSDAYRAAQRELDDAHQAVLTLPETERGRRATELDSLAGRLDAQRRQDWASYGAALMGHIWQLADDVGVGCFVRIDPASHRPTSPHRSVADQLVEQAVAAVPLPGEGRAPLDRLRDPTDNHPSTAGSDPTEGREPPASAASAAPRFRSPGVRRRQLDRVVIPRAATPPHRGGAPGQTQGPGR